MAGQTALVTGATGFLGGALAYRLAAEGVQVRALARNPLRADYIKHVDQIDVVIGDITDAERMREVVQGCDLVFHLAAATSGPLDTQRQVNVEGTRSVARAAALAQVRRLVQVSSIAVYGFCYGDIITEDFAAQAAPRSLQYQQSRRRSCPARDRPAGRPALLDYPPRYDLWPSFRDVDWRLLQAGASQADTLAWFRNWIPPAHLRG